MSCPICTKRPAERFRPFCSKRCADIDLGRWLTGSYAVPADSPEAREEAEAALAQGGQGGQGGQEGQGADTTAQSPPRPH